MARSLTVLAWLLVGASLVVASADGAQAEELRQIRAIGLSRDDPIYFVKPYDIDWDAAGNAYVLSGGDCRVVCFQGDWGYSHTFSRQGSAPGELNMVMQLLVVEGQVWVKVPRGVEVFSLAGEYVGLVRMPLEVSSIVHSDGGVFGVSRSGSGIGVELTLAGEVAAYFGPEVGPVSDLESILKFQSWQPVVMEGEKCSLVDRFDGLVWRQTGDSGNSEKVDLGVGRGSSEGGRGFRNAVVDVCRDPKGGSYLLHFDHESSTRYLVHYDSEWRRDGRWVIPEEVVVGTVRVSPRGELCLLSESESVLYVYERPEGGGSD